jgi:hypothetical protein
MAKAVFLDPLDLSLVIFVLKFYIFHILVYQTTNLGSMHVNFTTR